MLQRHIFLSCATLALACMLVGCGAMAQAPAAQLASAPPPAGASARVPAFKHIFLIVMENKQYDQVIGNPQSPYVNALARQYDLAANYYAIQHPSLPNYLALTGGDTFGVTSDCINCVLDKPNLIDELEGGGKSWKAYMEGMPTPCDLAAQSGTYYEKHDPFVYYRDIRTNPQRCSKIVPFSQFKTDLAQNALPEFSWITPDICHDTHDCPSDRGDRWLQTWVSQIVASPAWRDQGVLFVTWDEGKGSEGCCQDARGGHIATLLLSPLARPAYRSTLSYDHYSLLRTIEDAWRLPRLGNSACQCSSPMADFFAS